MGWTNNERIQLQYIPYCLKNLTNYRLSAGPSKYPKRRQGNNFNGKPSTSNISYLVISNLPDNDSDLEQILD